MASNKKSVLSVEVYASKYLDKFDLLFNVSQIYSKIAQDSTFLKYNITLLKNTIIYSALHRCAYVDHIIYKNFD